ncbi:hypothetical protein HMPREF9597_00573 [Cutibacterium acnes HL005PA4]|nr:hypothetical protein HMPREF9597_00573 [Cutibacterium acnes HL005PA4]
MNRSSCCEAVNDHRHVLANLSNENPWARCGFDRQRCRRGWPLLDAA